MWNSINDTRENGRAYNVRGRSIRTSHCSICGGFIARQRGQTCSEYRMTRTSIAFRILFFNWNEFFSSSSISIRFGFDAVRPKCERKSESDRRIAMKCN